MTTEWEEAAQHLTTRGALGLSGQTLSSLQATRADLGLEPVELPTVEQQREHHRAAVSRLADMGADMRTQAELEQAEAAEERQGRNVTEHGASLPQAGWASIPPAEEDALRNRQDPAAEEEDPRLIAARFQAEAIAGIASLARSYGMDPVHAQRQEADAHRAYAEQEAAQEEWAEHDAAEHDAVSRELEAEQQAELDAEAAGEDLSVSVTDDGDTATPEWLGGAEPDDAAWTPQPDLDTYPYNLSADEFNQARQDAAVRATGEETRAHVQEVTQEESDAIWADVHAAQVQEEAEEAPKAATVRTDELAAVDVDEDEDVDCL